MEKIQKSAIPIIEFILILVCVLAVLLPTSPANMPFTNRDSGVFLYTGSRILQGDLPYLQVWDHKPPVIFYVNALGLLLSGGTRWGVWSIEFIAISAAAFLGYRLLKKALGVLPSIISTYLWLFTLYFLLQGGNLATEYTIPIQWGCIWLFYHSEEEDNPSWHWFLIGMLCSIAFLIKQNTVGIGIAIFLYVIFQRSARGEYRNMLREISSLLLGSLPFLFLVGLYFGLNNGLEEFWRSAFVYNFYYSSSDFASYILATLSGLGNLPQTYLFQFAILGWLAGAAVLLFRKGIQPQLRPLIILALINFPIEIALVGITSRDFAHYFMALLPIFALLTSILFWLIFDLIISWNKSPMQKQIKFLSLNKTVGTYIQSMITICLVVVILIINIDGYFILKMNNHEIRDNGVISYIKNTTSEEDTVLLWGGQTRINFFAERESPSRFAYQFPLYRSGFTNEALIEEFLSEIVFSKPALIIDTRHRSTPYLEFELTSSIIQEKINYLQNHYVETRFIGDWVVYEFVGSP